MMNTQNQDDNLSKLKRKDFQKTVNGKETDLFILRNEGIEVAVTNYGCAILSIMVPDKNGNYANVVLGHDNIDSVINSPEPFLNTIIGRYGNRIAKGKFTLNGEEYTLAINNGPNSLHGGPGGFHSVVWDAEQIDEQTVVFSYLSKDEEEGFPGNLNVKMSYTLEADKSLYIDYQASCDKSTVINLTNHAFFNLCGTNTPTPSVENHVLHINADHYIPIDEVSIPTGEILKVKNTPMDFLTPQTVGSRINDKFEQLVLGAGYDHCYVVNKKEYGEFAFAAKCSDPQSGRTMEVYTTEPGVQLYTGNWLNGFTGTHGSTYPARSGICFEAQFFPDTPNNAYFPTAVLNTDEEYEQTTLYKFGVEE